MKNSGLLFLLLFLLVTTFKSKGEEQKIVYQIDIKKEIDNTTRIYLRNGLEEAKSLGADAILLHMNTYGGLLEAADSMRTAILYNPIPVYVFIDNNQTGAALPDKYQSYMRSMIRSTAEAHGKDTIIQGKDTTFRWKRDPLIAEAMVDERVVVPQLIDSGKVLTFTADEALEWRYCDGIAETPGEVITKYLGYNDYELKTYKPSWYDDLKGFLMNPMLQSLLIIIIIGGIYFEMQTPGLGFPSAAAVAAAILYFAPLYLDGLAQNWEILVFIIGLLLIAAEIFIIPGFGIAGISGIIFLVAGLTLSLLNNTDFNFEEVSTKEIGEAVLTVLIGLGLGFVLMIWLSNKIGTKGMLRKVALHKDLEDAHSSPSLAPLIGKEGTAFTVLRPSGKVMIDNELYDGVSDSGFIEKGTKVKVVRFENAQVYVETFTL